MVNGDVVDVVVVVVKQETLRLFDGMNELQKKEDEAVWPDYHVFGGREKVLNNIV